MNEHNISAVWPDWKVVREIGKGGFGTVYEAVRTEFNTESRAAIKIIDIPQNQSEPLSLRAEGLSEQSVQTYYKNVINDCIHEINLMETLKGTQNIVSIEDYQLVHKENEIGGQIYIRMELLTPFNEYVKDKKLSEKEVVKLGIDICTALELCQKTNIIHRDIKPENIFIHRFGDFKLGDFGIAKKLENSTVALSKKFTYNYMAPEVETNPSYDASVDQYSLGLVLYKLMNQNRLPFIESESQMKNPSDKAIALRRRMKGDVFAPPCEASPLFASIIMQACSYDPKKRFKDPSAMKKALTYVLNDLRSKEHSGTDSDKTIPVPRPVKDPDSTIAVHPPTGGVSDSGNRSGGRPPLNGQGGYDPGRPPLSGLGGYDPGRIPSGGTGGYDPGRIPSGGSGGYDPGRIPSGGQGGYEPEKGDKKDLRSIILIGVAAIIIGCAVLLYHLFGPKQDKPEVDSISTSSISETEEPEVTPEPEITVSSAEEEEPVTWQDAYIEYFNSSMEDGERISGFMLFDADGDEVPELLLWYEEHSTVGLISWNDNSIQENGLGEYCSTIDSMSGITYYPKDRILYSKYISPSTTRDPVLYVLKNGRLERVEKISSKKNATNYVLADAYQPTVKNFAKRVNAWSPKTAFAGRKPITSTPTPPPDPTPEPTPEPQPEVIPAPPVYSDSVKLPLCDVYAPASDFVFPDSSERYLTEAEVDSYVRSMAGDDPELIACYSQLIISEIEARYGYVFPTQRVAGRFSTNYFSGLDWYETAKLYCPVGQGEGEALVQNYCNEYERYNIYKVVAPWQAKNNNDFNG